MLVGSGSAALAGLVFVAITINLRGERSPLLVLHRASVVREANPMKARGVGSGPLMSHSPTGQGRWWLARGLRYASASIAEGLREHQEAEEERDEGDQDQHRSSVARGAGGRGGRSGGSSRARPGRLAPRSPTGWASRSWVALASGMRRWPPSAQIYRLIEAGRSLTARRAGSVARSPRSPPVGRDAGGAAVRSARPRGRTRATR